MPCELLRTGISLTLCQLNDTRALISSWFSCWLRPELGSSSQIHFTFLSLNPKHWHHPPGLCENLTFPFLEQQWSAAPTLLSPGSLQGRGQLWLCLLDAVSTDRICLSSCHALDWGLGESSGGEMVMLCWCCFCGILLRASLSSSLKTRSCKSLVEKSREAWL